MPTTLHVHPFGVRLHQMDINTGPIFTLLLALVWSPSTPEKKNMKEKIWGNVISEQTLSYSMEVLAGKRLMEVR